MWENAYLAKQIIVAASAVYKNLSKTKCCSKGNLFRYRHVTFVMAFVYYLMFILIMWKQIGGYIYQLVSGELPFTVTCSEKEQSRKISF